MRRAPWERRSAFAVALALGALAPLSRLQAETDPLESLKQQFQKYPARAFQSAARMFRDPQRKGDLDGMMAIIRIVGPASRHRHYMATAEEMIEAAIPVAQQTARWTTLGDLHMERAELLHGRGALINLRYIHSWQAGRDAYLKAGALPARCAGHEWRVQEFSALHAGWDSPEESAKRQERGTYGRHFSQVVAIERAIARRRDSEAVGLAHQLVSEVAREDDPTLCTDALCVAASAVWLRGGDRLLQAVMQVVESRRISSENVGWAIFGASTWAWTGRDDLFRGACYWWLSQFSVERHSVRYVVPLFAGKLRQFGRTGEAERVLRFYVWCLQAQRCVGYTMMSDAIWPEVPADLRRALVDVGCRWTKAAQREDLERTVALLHDGVLRLVSCHASSVG